MRHKVYRTLYCSFCGSEFRTNHSRAEYCSSHCSQNASKRRRAFDIPRRMKELATGARHRAKPKGISYNIDGEYLLTLWEDQKGLCCVTGEPFDLSYDSGLQKGWSKRNAPSVDRVVPELGYIKGNVRLVTFQVNCAKGLYSDEEFYKMCELALKERDR